jgi:hypothetical protein
MPDYKLLVLASHLRARAEEILTRAESMHDAEARLRMSDIAAQLAAALQTLAAASGVTWLRPRRPRRCPLCASSARKRPLAS